MQTILLVLHISLGLALIAIILLQQGAGATAGAAFGSGASSTVFGSRGSASFLTRTTGVLALVFFANSFFLAYLSGQTITPKSILEQTEVSAPVVDAPNIDLPGLPAGTVTDDLPMIPE
jgi:preprotein translocase subunit SecG|tara:strand:- start:129 stop:485 length:357 start_codon:yes stop_codon:yes gene_type:complete